jgi:BASS family bile acid:Na+ symporter
VPLAAYLIGKFLDRPFGMGSVAVPKLVVISVLIPLIVGIVFRKILPDLAKRIANPLVRIAGIVLLLGVVCILIVAMPTAWSLIGNGTILAFIAFVVVGIATGHLLGGPGADGQVTLALSTACRHSALALAIAGANFPEEHHVISAVPLYALTNAIFTIPYVAWQRMKAKVQAVPSQGG